MDLLTILKDRLEGKKILAREKNDSDGKPNKHIMTIDSITKVWDGKMRACITIYPLDSNKALPFYEYDIDLNTFSYQIIQTDEDSRL